MRLVLLLLLLLLVLLVRLLGRQLLLLLPCVLVAKGRSSGERILKHGIAYGAQDKTGAYWDTKQCVFVMQDIWSAPI